MSAHLPFSETHLGQLREVVGNRLLLVPGFRVILADPRGRVLLQHRSDFGLWGLPGGHPEEGESIEEAIRRETLEETGLEIGELEVIGFSSDPTHESVIYPNGHRIHSFCLIVTAREWSGQLTEGNSETIEVRFFDVEREPLPEMLQPERVTLKKYLLWKRTKKFQLF